MTSKFCFCRSTSLISTFPPNPCGHDLRTCHRLIFRSIPSCSFHRSVCSPMCWPDGEICPTDRKSNWRTSNQVQLFCRLLFSVSTAGRLVVDVHVWPPCKKAIKMFVCVLENSFSAAKRPGGTSDTVWLHVEEEELAGQFKTMLSACKETPICVSVCVYCGCQMVSRIRTDIRGLLKHWNPLKSNYVRVITGKEKKKIKLVNRMIWVNERPEALTLHNNKTF